MPNPIIKKVKLVDFLLEKLPKLSPEDAKLIIKTIGPLIKKKALADHAKEVDKWMKSGNIPEEAIEQETSGELVPEVHIENPASSLLAFLPLGAIIDGISSTNSYLIVAVKGQAGLIAIRYFPSHNKYKVKVYPNFELWGITSEFAEAAQGYYQKKHYARLIIDEQDFHNFLEGLHNIALPHKRKTKEHRFKVMTVDEMKAQLDQGNVTSGF